jgi:hypothetical protein
MTWSHRQYKRPGWRQLGAILVLTLFCVAPASAQGQNAVVRSDPPVLEISAGETATLTVLLAGAQDVYGIDVRAAFDPQLVEVVDADPAREGAQFTPGAFPQPDFVARNVADNQAGTLRYAITQINPTEPASGTGVLFTVQLRAKAAGGEAPFTIGPLEMADRTGQLLDVQAESSVIRVVPAEQATPTQAPAAAVIESTPAPTPAAAGPTATPTPAAAGAQPESLAVLLAVLALAALIAMLWFVIARRRNAR